MTRTALVTGANGFVGRAAVKLLASRGWRVRVAVRSQQIHIPHAAETIAVGDLGGDTNWTAAVQNVDVIAHIAGRAHVLKETSDDPLSEFRRVNCAATAGLARQAAAAGVKRLVFISTIGVNGGETCGTPLRANMAAAPHSPYALSKWEAEQELAAIAATTGLEICIIRPPLVLGMEPKGNLATLVSAMRRGLPLPLGSVTNNRRDLVSVKTLCSLLAIAIDHPQANGETFLVSDGRPLSTRELVQELGRLHGLKPRFLPFPPMLLSRALQMLGKSSLASQLCGDLEVDMTETCERLGWVPPRTLD